MNTNIQFIGGNSMLEKMFKEVLNPVVIGNNLIIE